MLLMEQNLSSPLGAGQLAAEVAVSKRQLERLFRRDLGASLQQFGRDMRLSYAVWLMLHGDSRIGTGALQQFSGARNELKLLHPAAQMNPANRHQ